MLRVSTHSTHRSKAFLQRFYTPKVISTHKAALVMMCDQSVPFLMPGSSRNEITFRATYKDAVLKLQKSDSKSSPNCRATDDPQGDKGHV